MASSPETTRLRALAEGATPAGYMYDDDYISAAHPAAVLALLDEADRLREALHEIRDQGYVLGMGAADWPLTDCERALANEQV